MKQTRMLQIVIFLFAFTGTCWLSAQAQTPLITNEPEKNYVLTSDQAKRWETLSEFEKAQAERHAQAISAAVNTPVGEFSKDVHAAVQSTWLALNLARSQKGEWLARLQADHGCPDCIIADGKLTRPKTP